MGIMGLLRFAFLCIDLLAWPAIALGYPLFASIMAVESGSKYQMKKLVIYWTLFSLFSLFELAFVKIIVWIPFWSSVRFVVILWLVMPRFDGSNHAYEGLVRPILVSKLQEVSYLFHKQEEQICKRETCLDLVEKNIKENGPEAMEKLIALEQETPKCIKSQRETESEGKCSAATTKQLNETQAANRDTEILEALERSAAATKTHQVPYSQSTSSVSDAVSFVEETKAPEASADNRCPKSPSLVETQQEWTCDLCKVTAMSEILLDDHLQGIKHKSKLESLKASLLCEKDARPSPLLNEPQAAQRDAEMLEATNVSYAQSTSSVNQTDAVTYAKETTPPEASADNRRPKTPSLKKAEQEWTCDLCKVKTTSGTALTGHLRGSKHKSKLQALEARFAGPSHSATSKLNHGNASEVQMEAKEKTPSESSSDHVKTSKQVWSCDVCSVRTRSEKTLNEHYKGSKHATKLQSLNTCVVNKNGEAIVKKVEMSKYWCIVCNVKLLSDVSLASHLIGRRHSSNIKASIS